MSFLRAIVSSNRTRMYDESTSTSLDLSYITDKIIVMSTPATVFPKTMYRNPVVQVRKFLDTHHENHYVIFNFQGEDSDYSNEDFHGNVETFGWPDHHPPPFKVVPGILERINGHLSFSSEKVAVLHCKGKVVMY